MEAEPKQQKSLDKFLKIQVLLIGLLAVGETIFFFFEQNYFNTFLTHVLRLEPYYVSIMVSLSALMGLIAQIILGIKTDNTRSKYGRRRPFLLCGTIAGISMILFAFSNDFVTCLIIDVIIIGITTNAYLVAKRSLIPDIVEPELRGRANGIINIVSNLGLLVALALFLVANEVFAVPDPQGDGNIIPREGHLFLFSVGGLTIFFAALMGFFFIKEKPVEELPPKKKFFEDLKSTFNLEELKNQKEFFKITLALMIFKSGSACIMPFLFIFIFGLGLNTLQLLIGIGIAFPVLCGVIMYIGKIIDKYGRKRFLPIIIIVVCLGLFLVPFTKTATGVNLILVFVTFPFIMVALLGFITPTDAWSQDLLPIDKRGQFTGILNIVNTVSQIIGAVTAGIVATFLGIQWIFAFAPIFFLVAIPLFLKVEETLPLKV
ncbi:MAG: MFS transporter [Candidatus Lokiarchaeota archaeon]|nr:MFS transporter [Candidatus Lokiarchaeota archaeon]